MQKIQLDRRRIGFAGWAWASMCLVLAGMAWWMWGGGGSSARALRAEESTAAAGAFAWARSASAGEAFTPEIVAAQQAAAASAVAAQVRLVQDGEGDGVVTQRPRYVSEFEWVALSMAAQQHEQPQQELTRLVHYLGFMKQVELWRSLPRSPEFADQRRALAQELLRLLPRRLAQKDVDPAEAQQWQAAWQADAAPAASAAP